MAVYNGWFPALSRPIQAVSVVANAAARLPRGRGVLDAVAVRTIGGSGGPDVAERAKTLTHVVAIARDRAGQRVAEVHLEGPSPYTLTGDLMAWAAARLAAGGGGSAGVVGPVDAFGLDALVTGCAEVGLERT